MNKLYLLALIVLASCDPKPAPPANLTSTATPGSGIGEWKVDLPTATAMINSVKGKACNAFTITNQNAAMKALIDSTYPSGQYSYSDVDARYLPNADQSKYRRLRGMPPGSPKGDIRGYCTKLLVVRSISAGESTEEYFDIYTICPPPPDCDRDTLQSNEDTTLVDQ
jgi:hypothetical protein